MSLDIFGHPQTVHFPIALLWSAGALYLYGIAKERERWSTVAWGLHVAGTATMVVAIMTGMWEEEEVVHTAHIHELIEQHELMGFISVWVFTLLAVWGYLTLKKFTQTLYIVYSTAFVIALGVMSYGSHIGGDLVYEEGVGVEPMEETLKQQRDAEQHEP